MKKEILEALATKFQGVASSVLDRIATRLAKTVTTAEGVKTAVEGVTIQQVIESYTDSRVTEASETARRNAVQDYEARYGLKDGEKTANGGEPQQKGTTTTATNPAGGEQTPAWAQALIDRMDRMENAKTTDTRRQQLSNVIGRLPESMRKAYERLPLDKYTEQEFASALAEITTEVEGITNDTAAKGAIFGKPSAAGGQPNKAELTDAQKAAISHREGTHNGDGQPF